MSPIYAIDRCDRQGDVLLLQGWILPQADGTLARLLLSADTNGHHWSTEIPVSLDRPDVRALFPHIGNQATGFFYYGRLPGGLSAKLVAEFYNTTWPLLIIPAENNCLRNTWINSWRYFAQQAWILARNTQWRLLREKVHRRLGALSARKAHLDSRTLEQLHNFKPEVLIIDHDLGGGANAYRHRYIAQTVEEGRNIALVVYSLVRLAYLVTIHHRSGVYTLGLLSPHELDQALRQISPRTILYNNAVSDPYATTWPNLIEHYKTSHPHCRLIIAVHDFFMACPSPHLLDASGRFCGIPEHLSNCNACLKISDQPFVKLYPISDISLWRQQWSRLLRIADEFIVFSRSSADLLLRAYPHIDTSRISLRPHHVEPLSSVENDAVQHWLASRKPSGVIAVVGAITSHAKGAQVIANLAAWIYDQQLPWRVYVIGSCVPKIITPRPYYYETGPYHSGELTSKIIDANPDVFFFPSIAPETFSFVLHEIARYHRPIAAFPIGAQTEFLTGYDQAITLPLDALNSPSLLLRSLEPWLNNQGKYV